MAKDELKKVIYEDDKRTKILRGRILKEDEFTYTIEVLETKETIVIGKRAIIRIYSIDGDLK